MNISISLLHDVDDLYENFLKELGLSKTQYKKIGFKKLIKLKKRKELHLPCELLRNGEINPIYTGKKIRIIFEDNDFIVVSKPIGIHGHPQSFEETATVLNFLRSIGKGSHVLGKERGLLYRLDNQTSGVLLLANNQDSYIKIRENFSTFMKEKYYLAIVGGRMERGGAIEHDLRPFGIKGAKQVEALTAQELKKSKKAHLIIEKNIYNKKEDCTLLKIKLGTGLRHQIRAQLAILGFPILGDDRYGGTTSKRLFLHALEYSFDWEGKRRVFQDKEALFFDKFFDLNSCL